jgi:hypothetical protein
MNKLTGMDSPPGLSAPHLVADFVELMCTATLDGEWGLSDLRALRKAKDKDHATVREPSERELLLGEDDFEDGTVNVALAAALELPIAEHESSDDDGDGDDQPNADPGPAAADDARATEGSGVADVLAYRADRFGDAWPFELFDQDNLRMREPLEGRHRLYLFLLVASCLSNVAVADRNQVTTAFERLAPGALSGHLGPRAEVHLFGTTGDSGRYTGSLWERFQRLAQDLRVKLLAEQAEIEARGGDNGLDAVAWLPTGDDAATIVSIFAQCACGKKWRDKQHEGTELRWAPVLAFRTPIVNVTLIPYSFRRSDGLWHADYHVEKGVLLDRERILEALAANEADHSPLVPAVVDEVIRQGVA